MSVLPVAGLVAAEPGASGAAGAGPQGAEPIVEIGYDARASLQTKLDAIDQEVARLRRVGASPAAAEQLGSLLDRLRDRAAGKPSPTEDEELHVVGLYEGSFPNGPRKFGTAVVEVEDVDAPIVLVLCAYDPVRWDLRLKEGVKLRKLILAGYKDQELVARPEGVPVEIHTHSTKSQRYFYLYKRNADDAGRAMRTLRELTGLEMNTLVGTYRYEDRPLVVGPRNEDWRKQRVEAEAEPLYREATAMSRARKREQMKGLRFQAIRWTPGAMPHQAVAELGTFTPAGPIEGTLKALPDRINRVAVDPRGGGGRAYGIVGHYGFAGIDLEAGRATELQIEGDIPELSWPSGVAFDTKRNRVVLMSHGGEGFAYAYEPDAKRWSLLGSMQNTDVQALAYSADEDCLYALGSRFGGERTAAVIQKFDARGKHTGSVKLDYALPTDPMRMHMSPIQLVSIGGGKLALLLPPVSGEARGGAGAGDPAALMTCVVIDAKTGRVENATTMRPMPPPDAKVMDARLEEFWTALGEGDVEKAQEAERGLIAGGDRAVALIGSKLRPQPRPEDAEIRGLVKLLDADEVQEREKAGARLRRMGSFAEAELRRAGAGAASAEAKTRIDVLLKQLEDSRGATTEDVERVVDSNLRRELRAIKVLGRIGTPAAVEALRDAAASLGDEARVRHARAALREP